MRAPHPSRRGFTLIELLVVVAILAVVASLAMVSSGDDDAVAVDLAAIQVGDATERAHALALSTRVAHGVAFDVTGDRFAVVDEFGNVVRHPVDKLDWVVDFVTPGQPQGVTITAASFGATGTSIAFDADGNTVAGGSVTLTRGDVSRTLTLDVSTGELK